MNTSSAAISVNVHTYTNERLLELRGTFAEPEGIMHIILNGVQQQHNSTRKSKRHASKHSHHSRHSNGGGERGDRGGHSRRQQQSRDHKRSGGGGRGGGSHQRRSDWTRGGGRGGNAAPAAAVLIESANSFSAARRRKKRDQSQSDLIMGQIRGTLNKVTEDNFDLIQEEVNGTALFTYAAELDDDDQEDFLTDIAKLIVRKSQIDHEFNALYAALAFGFSEKLDIFGDIIYEVCRESVPTNRYNPTKKKDYLGALYLLVELRKRELVTPGGISACIDRLMSAIDRCDPNAVLSVVGGGDNNADINPAEQTELCVELVCKILPMYVQVECPSWIERIMQKLRTLSARKDRVKPRTRFMLGDFFKEMEKTLPSVVAK